MAPALWPTQPYRHPDLEERFQPPENLQFFSLDRGSYALRYAVCNNQDAKALIMICPGLRRPIEGLYELMCQLLDAGYSVACIDWRGQGESPRYYEEDYDLRGSDGFDHDVNDLMAWVNTLKKHHDMADLPIYGFAHSMGANILAHGCMQDPGLVERTVFCAPMMGITTPVLGSGPVRLLARLMMRMGLGHSYVPGHKKWSPTYEKLLWQFLSSDPVRARVQLSWLERRPELRIGGVSWEWLYHALQSCDALQGEAITLPSLIILAGGEHLVCNKSARKLAQKMPQAHVSEYKTARHEITMEADNIRDGFLSDIVAFFNA